MAAVNSRSALRGVTCRAYTTLDADEVAARTARVLAIKEKSGKTFDELAELGLTNTYTAQLFLGQAQLKPETASKLQALLPPSARLTLRPCRVVRCVGSMMPF